MNCLLVSVTGKNGSKPSMGLKKEKKRFITSKEICLNNPGPLFRTPEILLER